MDRVAKFEKVSFKEFEKGWLNASPFHKDVKKIIYRMWQDIKLPKRATVESAGYDFYLPSGITIYPKQSVLIPTGIRCRINKGWVLQIYPRSSLGFKHEIYLANTVGIIDGDYYNSANGGHIFIKLANNKCDEKFTLDKGKAFCQGIFLPYGITIDDNTSGIRDGGLGSTSN